MSTQTRMISTTTFFTLEQGIDQTFTVHRELVCDEDNDGSWLIYTVEPETVGSDGEEMAWGSFRVSDEASTQLLSDRFSMLADPAGFGSASALAPPSRPEAPGRQPPSPPQRA